MKSSATELRGALVGCGFFARYHAHAWGEVEGARLVAVCDRDEARARAFAQDFGIEHVYTDMETMLEDEHKNIDFVDVATQPDTHEPLVTLAARHGMPVICQKPLAPSLEAARAMVTACEKAGVPLMVHENFRWQAPMRALKEAAGTLGTLFFGQISFRSRYDVYAAQPYLATDERFILYDLGVHLLDLARFFFGEVRHLCAHTQRVNENIRGEDVATVVLAMKSGGACIVDLSYASEREAELFPQTLVRLEGTGGTAVLGPDYALTVTRGGETTRRHVPPRAFAWQEPPGEAVQDSVVAIQQHWADCLRTGRPPETSGADNLCTLELVFAAYDAADDDEIYFVFQRRT